MLIKNIKNGDFGLEGEVYFNLFKKYIKFAADEDVEVEYIEKCAAYLSTISNEVINNLCEASIRYCNDFLYMIGEAPKEFDDIRDILPMIYPSTLIVPNPEHNAEPVIHLELNCDWEIEHGMEWIVRNNEVLYVGGFNYEDPWGDFSVKKSWNYA